MSDQPQESGRDDPLLDKVIAAYLEAVEKGGRTDRAYWIERYPSLEGPLGRFFDDHSLVVRSWFEGSMRGGPPHKKANDAAVSFVAASSQVPPDAPSTIDPHEVTRPMSDPDLHVHALEPRPGTFVDDYEVLEKIAGGGMGVVFRARQRHAPHTVALKMIGAGARATPEEVRRFRSEVETAGRLRHPHIVPIYAVGEYRGQPYFTMMLMEGTLSSRVRELVRSPREAARIMVAIARAVAYAHHRAVLHLDLKPRNILIDGLGRPHVCDFGLARFVEDQPFDPERTEVIGGTLRYMAPEQAEGRAANITIATDIYGLGAVLYELLTGDAPAQGSDRHEIRENVIEGRRSRPSHLNPLVDADLEAICEKCLSLTPAERYRAAEDLERDLVNWLHRRPVDARPVGWLERARYWVRRYPAIAALLALLTFTIGAGSVGTTINRKWAIQAEAHSILTTRFDEVPEAIRAISPHRDEVLPYLRASFADRHLDLDKRLRASLAVMALDPSDGASADFVLDRLALADVARCELGFARPLSELRAELLRRVVPSRPPSVQQRAFLVFQLAQILGWTPEELSQLSEREWAALLDEMDSFPTVERRRIFHLAYERFFYSQTLDALALQKEVRQIGRL